MNCPGLSHCAYQEYHSLRNCGETGQCQNEPGPDQVEEFSSSSTFDESNPERVGRGAALTLIAALVVASVLLGD